ncbi:MAG: metallophosphoesterase [bacterium]
MNWLFDIVTFFYLIVVGAFLIEISMQWKESKHRPVIGTIGVIFALSWVIIFFGAFIEPHRLDVKEVDFSMADESTDVIKAVVVSDFHVGPYKKGSWIEKVVQKVNEQDPDIIFIPGDFISSGVDDIQYLRPLRDLKAPLGVFAVTGNHDYAGDASDSVISALLEMGITVLENEKTIIYGFQKEVILAGISDIWFEGNVYKTLSGTSDEDLVILLSHNPDAVLYANADLADLIISGHTHGGQIRLPFFGSVSQIPNVLGRDYDQGLFWYGNQPLFVTSGVGETGPRARLFNSPEIVIMNISF